MSESDTRWLALSLTGLALATTSLLLSDGVGAAEEYSVLALALLLGFLGVWSAQRRRSDE